MTLSARNYVIAIASAIVIAVSLSACGGGGPPTIVNGPEPPVIPRDPVQEELGRLIERSANVDAFPFGYAPTVSVVQVGISGSDHLGLAQSYRDRYAYAIPWRDGDGALKFSIGIDGEDPEIDERPVSYQGRTVAATPDNLIPDLNPALGQTSHIDWQAFSVTNGYIGDGTLDVQVVTDVANAEAPGQPWVGYRGGASGRTILLDNVPNLLPGHDWQGISIDPGESMTGSLDGAEGEFSCYGGQFCTLETFRNEAMPGYYPNSGTVVFTPADGSSPVMLTATTSAPVAAVDYLVFGIWQYVADDIDSEGYDFGSDFGVFAGGGDPFDYGNGVALTGTATYAGDAVGMYYMPNHANISGVLSGSSSGPVPQLSPAPPPRFVGSFSADVTLTAEFGTDTEAGMLSGRVHDFTYDGEALFEEVFLREAPISDSSPEMIAQGQAATTAESESETSGLWSAAFFGNDPDDPAVHPTGVAGTFGVGRGERGGYGAGLVGAFGAHRQ